ncbi:MAG: hypothetical protein ACU84Q_06565, partial [Gammaproteobacteria bacterium]
MNWEAAGVIAEIVGALAVVITLIYLAVQIRLAREESQVQGTYSSVDLYANWRSHLINNPGLADLIAKANSDEELTAGERMRAAAFMDDLALTVCVSYTTGAKSNPLYERRADLLYLVNFLRSNPGLEAEWERISIFIDSMQPGFASTVSALRKELGS